MIAGPTTYYAFAGAAWQTCFFIHVCAGEAWQDLMIYILCLFILVPAQPGQNDVCACLYVCA